jgi:molecular chaperone GrpE (heat shock protein)
VPVRAELTDLETYAPADDEDDQTTGFGQRKTLGWASASENANQEDTSPSSRPPSHETEAEAETADGGVAVLVAKEETCEDSVDSGTELEDEDNPGGTGKKKHRFTPRPKVAVLGQELSSLKTEFDAAATAPDGETSLADQADDLQKQLAEFREMAQSVQQATREQASPVGDTLKDLAQQVSAIREYAASQQNRVEKLQDGYDWNIIRTFCLRVIRCIDNMERRIDDLTAQEENAADLEDVRDELLFALESSGVEQFRLEINSEYRGQEKLAEAVKEKEECDKPDKAGKIAKVIRPGYRYMIDDENYKVVRTAQVKLFG